ncbi:MAG: response regulator [Pirellulales bacterium]
MKRRILAVDDEETWRKNYRLWIPVEVADQDSAGSAQEAASLLCRRRYDVVLLDLSMDPDNPLDRSTRPVQDYLSTHPEGTLYLVASGVIEDRAEEVRDAYFRLGASQVLFKPEIDHRVLCDELERLFAVQGDLSRTFIAEAKNRLIGDMLLETQAMAALGVGAKSLFQALDTVFRRLAPVAQHRERPKFVVSQDALLALTWSRQLGHAVSIVLHPKAGSAAGSRARLSDWLGFIAGNPLFSDIVGGHLQVQCFAETGLSSEHFDLPSIA